MTMLHGLHWSAQGVKVTFDIKEIFLTGLSIASLDVGPAVSHYRIVWYRGRKAQHTSVQHVRDGMLHVAALIGHAADPAHIAECLR